MAIKTFTEGGKGRKKCPGCIYYVAAVTKKCNCDHVFVKANGKTKSKVTRYEAGGKGRKQCGACNFFVAQQTKICSCGYKFVSNVAAKLSVAASKPKESKESYSKTEVRDESVYLKSSSGIYPRDRCGGGIMRTRIAAGGSPHKLKGTSSTEVYEWIEKVLRDKEDERNQLMSTAVKFWASDYYDVFSDEYKLVSDHIDSYWAGELVGCPSDDEPILSLGDW